MIGVFSLKEDANRVIEQWTGR